MKAQKSSQSLSFLNPTGGLSLGANATITVQITDDTSEPTTNSIDNSDIFDGQRYRDFLNHRRFDN